MIITERDKKIREFLLEVTVSDTKSLSILFFDGSLRACQSRLKKLVDIKYIKCFREGIPGQNIFYVNRKCINYKHKMAFAKLLAKLKQQNIEVIKYKCPLKIDYIIADGFIAIKKENFVELYLVEIEITKKFNLNKYLDLYYFKKYKDKFPVMPNILVITNKQVNTDDSLNIKKCKLDLSDLKI